MSIIKERAVTLKDADTKEEVRVAMLENGNYVITINGVVNQIKPDIFGEMAEVMREMSLD